MTGTSSEFRREYLVRLPLPLAQLYGRAFNAKSPRERHDNAFYLFEALVKLAATTATAYYLEEVSIEPSSRVPMLDRLLAQLALPSLGQWLGILREVSRHFASRVDTPSHPWGKPVWDGLSATRKDLPGMLALHQRIKNGPDGDLATDQTCSLLGVLEGLVQYRNSVFGHGAGRMESFYESEMGPLLFPAINEVLAEGRFSILGPTSARLVYITELRLLENGLTQVDMRELVGLQGERIASLEVSSEQAARLLPNRVGLLWPGRTYPLRLDPLLQYRESEFSEEVLFLNRDRNRKQVEYLSYTTGRTERDRTMMSSLAALLSQVTNHTVSEADLQKLSEQSLAETPSLETLFQENQPAGQSIGEYELISELGRGGMGVVYLARQTSLGRLVALKMLPSDLAGDELAIARFKREIRHLARCDDPHIVKVLSSGTLPDGRVYFTMEYVPGSDLEMIWKELSRSAGQGNATSTSMLGDMTWTEAVQNASRKNVGKKTGLAKDPSTPSEPIEGLSLKNATDDPGGYIRRVVTMARDVATALQAIHEQGVIHRDVKPANLMLTSDGSRVVLMDFGLAKGQTNSMAVSRDGGLLGTLRYAAPEQLAAANIKVGPAADVRGLGVTMWELLTRQRLFGAAEDEASLTQDVLTADVPRLRSIDHKFDRDLDAIVARATERRQTDRIQSAGQLAEYLQLWLDGKPLPIRPLSISELSMRWVREHAALAITSGVIAALLVTTGFVILRGNLITRQRSQQALRQLLQQTDAILKVASPSIAKDIEAVDVEVVSAVARIDSLQEQSNTIQKVIDSGILSGDDLTQASSIATSVKEQVSEISKHVRAVEKLVAARALRFGVTEKSFQLANSRATVFGREGIDIYAQVFASLASTDVVSDAAPPDEIGVRLRSHGITQHLRMAIDDWFILCFREEERATRKRLASIAEQLDEGPEKPIRQAIRAAIVNEDSAALTKLADNWREGSFTSDKLSSGLLLADGLLENLRVGHSIELLRLIKFHGASIHPPATRFIRLWANNLLGVLLCKVGSNAEIQEAMQSFEAAYALEPGLDVIRINMARCELLLARPAEAIRRVETVKDGPLAILKQVVRALALAQSGRAAESRKIAEQIEAEQPNSILALYLTALIYQSLLDTEAARTVAIAGLQIEPQSADLVAIAYNPVDPAYARAMSNISDFDVRHWWQGKIDAANNKIYTGFASHDYNAVNEARDALRILGMRDWSFSELEFRALFTGRDLNALSWESTLRKLHEEAPRSYAERYPSTTLGALIDLQGSLGSDEIQQLLLREAISFPVVAPYARLERLEASAKLLSNVEPSAAYKFYQATLNVIPLLDSQGFGSAKTWQERAKFNADAMERLQAPEAIDATTAAGKERRMLAHRRYGLALRFAGNKPAARVHFESALTLARQLTTTDPGSTEVKKMLLDAILDVQRVSVEAGEIDVSHRLALEVVTIAESLRNTDSHTVDLRTLAEVYREAANVEVLASQLPKAKHWIEKAISIYEQLHQKAEQHQVSVNPGNDLDAALDLANAHVASGSMDIDLKDFASAREHYLQSLSLVEPRANASPNNHTLQSFLATVQIGLGRVAFNEGKLDTSIQHFERAASLAERLVANRQEKAEELQLAAQTYNWLGTIHQSKGDNQAAMKWIEKEVTASRRRLQFSPQNPDFRRAFSQAIHGRALAKLAMQQLDEALQDWNEAIATMPDNAELWQQRGLVHYAKSEWQSAIDDLTQAMKLDSNVSAFSWRVRADSFANLERWKEASEDYDQLVKLLPEDANAHVQAGMINLLAGKADHAVELLTNALKMDPSIMEAHRYLANALAAQSDWTASLEHYSVAMSRDFGFPNVWAGAQNVAVALKDRERADAICMKAADKLLTNLNPDQADTVVWICSRYPGNAKVVELLQQLSEALPGDGQPDPLQPVTRAALNFRLEQWDQCASLLEKWLAIEKNKSDENAWLLLTLARAKQKKLAEAQAAFQRAEQAAEARADNAEYLAPIRWSLRFETEQLRLEATSLLNAP